MLMEDPGGTSNKCCRSPMLMEDLEVLVTNVCRSPMLMEDPGGTSNKCL